MTETIKYRLFKNHDLDAIKILLQESELPIDDIRENKIGFIVAINDTNELIGCIGLEQHGENGLLRSFAVDAAYRGKGIGHGLFNRLLSISRQNNISNLHLLTTTAEKFFERAGFILSTRNDAPASIKTTVEFSSLCPSSCTYMVMGDIQKTIKQKIQP